MVSPKLASALKKAKALGRGGDTMLAHINPKEADLLQKAGGSGTVNPHTGLPEFMAEDDSSYGGGGYGYGQSNYGSNGGGDTSGGWSTGYSSGGGGGGTTYRSAAAVDAATDNYGGGGYGVGQTFGPSPNSSSGASDYGGSWNSPSSYSNGTSVSNSSPTRSQPSAASSLGSALSAGAGMAQNALSSIGSGLTSFSDSLNGILSSASPTVNAYGAQVSDGLVNASDALNNGIASGYNYAKNFISQALDTRSQPSYTQYASGGVGAPGSDYAMPNMGPPGLRSEAANGGYEPPSSFPSMVPSIDPGPGMDPNSYIGGSRLVGYEGSGNTVYSGFGNTVGEAGTLADLPAPNAVDTAANLKDLNPRLADLIDRFQSQFPDVEITSGFRDPTTNLRVGGAKHSQHLEGNAFDFSVKGLSDERQAEVANWLRDNGAAGFGYYPNSQSMHADLGSARYWGPNYSSSSLDRTPSWFQSFAGGTRMDTQVPTPPPRPENFGIPDSQVAGGSGDYLGRVGTDYAHNYSIDAPSLVADIKANNWSAGILSDQSVIDRVVASNPEAVKYDPTSGRLEVAINDVNGDGQVNKADVNTVLQGFKEQANVDPTKYTMPVAPAAPNIDYNVNMGTQFTQPARPISVTPQWAYASPADVPAQNASVVAEAPPQYIPNRPVTPTPEWAYNQANPNAYASPLTLPAQPTPGVATAVNAAFSLFPGVGLLNTGMGLFGKSIGDMYANRENIPMTPEEAQAAENRLYAQGEGKGSNSGPQTFASTASVQPTSDVMQSVKAQATLANLDWQRAAIAHGYSPAQLADPKVAALIKQIYDMGLIPKQA